MIRGGRVLPQQKFWMSSHASAIPHFDEVHDYLRLLDCNSLYPWAMLSNTFPTGRYTIVRDGLEQRHLIFRDLWTATEPDWLNSMFEVDVRCPTNLLTPFLSARSPTGGLLYDLLPKERERYYGFELLHAVRELNYDVTKVHSEWRWLQPNALPLFVTYVEKLYQVRLKNKGTALDACAKLALNGKVLSYL